MARGFSVAGATAILIVVGGAHYVVGPGDTLSSIAQREGVSVEQLDAVNDIRDVDLVLAGTRLIIPTSSMSGASSDGHQNHLVRRGESVDSIAKDHGVSARAIRDANGIVDDVIYAGTTLRLGGTGFVTTFGSKSTHRVAADDTLKHFAEHHGVSAHELAHWNGMGEDSSVSAGQALRIPARWVCPVAGARYFNDWGFPRSNGRIHSGNDLFATRGTPVRAPESGHVTLRTGSIGGKQFVLEADTGIRYSGSHLDAFERASHVRAGDVIGYVGDSGNAQGSSPHLHFEIRPNEDLTVNPYPTLVANSC